MCWGLEVTHLRKNASSIPPFTSQDLPLHTLKERSNLTGLIVVSAQETQDPPVSQSSSSPPVGCIHPNELVPKEALHFFLGPSKVGGRGHSLQRTLLHKDVSKHSVGQASLQLNPRQTQTLPLLPSEGTKGSNSSPLPPQPSEPCANEARPPQCRRVPKHLRELEEK